MKMAKMYLLKTMLEGIAKIAQGNYYLSEEEKLALLHFNQAADKGEDYRIFLLQMAYDVGLEPKQLLYMRRLAGMNVSAIGRG